MDDRLTTEMDKRRWRKRHSLAIRWIAARVIATFFVPVAIAVIALVGFSYLGFESAEISTYWWSITAIAIYIGAFTYGEVYNREARRLFRDTRIALEKHREVLKKNLEPSVEVLRSREDVMRAVGELLVEASAQTQETQTEHGTSRPSQRIVYYFGSANLSPTIAEIKASQRLEGGDMTAVEIYQKGMEEVKRALVQVRQFIRLFDEENFPNRSFEFRRAHLDWLDAQLNLMKTSPNFALYDSRRAPRWNSSLYCTRFLGHKFVSCGGPE